MIRREIEKRSHCPIVVSNLALVPSLQIWMNGMNLIFIRKYFIVRNKVFNWAKSSIWQIKRNQIYKTIEKLLSDVTAMEIYEIIHQFYSIEWFISIPFPEVFFSLLKRLYYILITFLIRTWLNSCYFTPNNFFFHIFTE